MRLHQQLILILAFIACFTRVQAAVSPIHVWEMQELRFTAKNAYKNPYTDVTIWVELTGPGFNKRIYGFWNGNNTFLVRLVAVQPGTWSWKSGSSSNDPGLSNQTGTFADS